MLKTTFFFAFCAIMAALSTPSDALSWGAAQVGYTHVGPGGVQHYGATAAAGPNRYGSMSHYGATGGNAYGGHHYGTTSAYGGASYGGYHYGGYNTNVRTAGVYRRW